MRTNRIIVILAFLAGLILSSGCAALRFQPDSWHGSPNPLDSLNGEPTADELHRDNLRAITSNPGYQIP